MLKVNGKAYDWGDVDLKIPGLNIQVQEISYDDELEIEEVYGYGSKPRGYGTGNYKASGKLSMLRDDYDDLLAYCKQKGVPFYKMELPSIIVSYANEGARTKIDELKKVKFSKRSNKAAQGDKSLTVDVDMMIVGGVYQDGAPTTRPPPAAARNSSRPSTVASSTASASPSLWTMRARKSSPTTSSAPPSPAMTATSRPLHRASPRRARRSCWTRSSTRTPSV